MPWFSCHWRAATIRKTNNNNIKVEYIFRNEKVSDDETKMPNPIETFREKLNTKSDAFKIKFFSVEESPYDETGLFSISRTFGQDRDTMLMKMNKRNMVQCNKMAYRFVRFSKLSRAVRWLSSLLKEPDKFASRCMQHTHTRACARIITRKTVRCALLNASFCLSEPQPCSN